MKIPALAIPLTFSMLGLLATGCGGADAADDGTGTGDDGVEQGAAAEALTDVGAETDDELAQLPWDTLGTGVHVKTIAGGSNVLVVYGGYSAQDLYVERWADELVRAKNDTLGVGTLVAVRGPNQAGYQNREIANSKLAAYLGANGRAQGASSIVVVAHSSGTYVAAEFLAQIKAGRGNVPSDTLAKVTLYNLDGGGLDASTVHAMKNAYFVYACDANIGSCSHNASSMKALGNAYKSAGGAIKVRADGSGCSASGLWCLHDTLITTRPHNPMHYDLARDYTDFKGSRKVVTSYLDTLDSP